jgi:release factor glutamine methyltransferase
VLGEWEFYGRTFQLTQDVLIPRPETELLVETALDFLRHRPGIRLAADVGTGSGCVAVTLLAETANLHALATDRSLAALRVASQNAIAQKVRSRFHAVEMDLLAGLRRPIDLICANLPYVSTADLDHLPVGRREPRLALDGGPDGLALTGRLLSDLPRCLAPGGRALLEIGAGQGPTLLSYLPEARPRLHAKGMADLAGHDRLMVIDRNAT